ncbi:MAG: hypothetical protein O3A46_14755, partial [Candidatus Poribacteria bacterium]|nr:hypothetical protein [Candidatus Poribacteria bacterium]
MIDHETPRRIRLARSIAAAWAGFGSALVLMVCFVRIGATQSERELRLSLSDAITLAVEQNLTLRQARLDPDIRQALIDARNDRFKPVISVGSG